MNELEVLSNEDLGNTFWIFWRSEVIFLNLFKVLWRCFLKLSCEPRTIPKSFREIGWITKLRLKKKKSGRWYWYLVSGLKITSCAWFDRSGLKFIFLWNTQLLILVRSCFKYFADEFTFLIKENCEVSWTKNFALILDHLINCLCISKTILSPWGSLEEVLLQCLPIWNFLCLKQPFCFLYFKTFVRTPKRLHDIPFCFSLNRRPSSHTLSKALNISRNNRVTCFPWWYQRFIKWFLYFTSNRYKLTDTLGYRWKPDWLDEINSFSINNLNI